MMRSTARRVVVAASIAAAVLAGEGVEACECPAAVACTPAAATFSIGESGGVEGLLVREDGAPAVGTSVALVPEGVRDADVRSRSTAASTDRCGRFSIGPVAPGRYYVAVNVMYGPTLRSPFAAAYFPGSAAVDGAEIIEIAEGERKTGLSMTLTPLAEMMMSGVVLLDDDHAAANAQVLLFVEGHRGLTIASARADQAGRFELRALHGVRYRLFASLRTADGPRTVEMFLTAEDAIDGVRLLLAQ